MVCVCVRACARANYKPWQWGGLDPSRDVAPQKKIDRNIFFGNVLKAVILIHILIFGGKVLLNVKIFNGTISLRYCKTHTKGTWRMLEKSRWWRIAELEHKKKKYVTLRRLSNGFQRKGQWLLYTGQKENLSRYKYRYNWNINLFSVDSRLNKTSNFMFMGPCIVNQWQ
jgi:hypothetical protein